MPEVTEKPAISADEFVGVLRRSGLVAADALDNVLCDYELNSIHADDLAAALLDRQLITNWQSRQLLKARWRGYRLGKYLLLEELGRGGMAKVFLARHQTLRSFVAIKVLSQARTQKASMVERFMREARAAAQISHPNLVRVFDVDTDENRHYLVMEYIKGNSVQGLVDSEGVLSFERAARFARQTAEGLACAHQLGMIHRDIKPANLLVEDGKNVKISDFGLALVGVGEEEEGPSLTLQHDERVLGTADYIAPEQAVNSHTVDARADLYSLGYTLYFMLTGQPPFPTGRIVERLTKHCTAEPQSIRKFRPDIPEGLLQIVHRLTRKNASKRFPSAAAAAEALDQWASGNSQRGATAAAGESRLLDEGSMRVPVPVDDEPLELAPEYDEPAAQASRPAKSTHAGNEKSLALPEADEQAVEEQANSLLSDLLDELPPTGDLLAGADSNSHSPLATDSADHPEGGSPLGAPRGLTDTNNYRSMITAAEKEAAEEAKESWLTRLYEQFKRGEYPLWLLIGAGLILGGILLVVAYSYISSFISPPPIDRIGE